MIQFTLALKMTITQVVKISVTVNNNPIEYYTHSDNHILPTYVFYLVQAFFVLIIYFLVFMTLDCIWRQEVYRTQSDNSGGQRSLQRHKSSRQIRYKVSLTKLLCISIVLANIMSKESLRIKGNLCCFIKNVTSQAA